MSGLVSKTIAFNTVRTEAFHKSSVNVTPASVDLFEQRWTPLSTFPASSQAQGPTFHTSFGKNMFNHHSFKYVTNRLLNNTQHN